MFDDQMPKNQSGGQVPGNLPIGEPEDMFSTVDEIKTPTEVPTEVPTEAPEVGARPATPSALDAGILRPISEEEIKTEPKITTMPDLSRVEEGLGIQKSRGIESSQAGAGDVYAIKEPTLTRGLVTMIIVVVSVLILGAGGWWIYNSFIRVPDENAFVVPPVDLNMLEEEIVLPVVETQEPIVIEEPDLVENDITQDIIDEQILFGELIDKDGDTLDDQRELEIGTDPNNWDTDGDGLSDGDEVIIWKTDPLNPDSDGDTYLDGDEVKNGYNPAGDGKLFEPPVEEEGGGGEGV